MATLFMLCGLPCSGKSTLAREIEAEQGALRLLPDEWIVRLGLDPRDQGRRSEIERIQVEIAARVLAKGCDVILEAGFWHRYERQEGRDIAKAAGGAAKLIFLDVPLEELQRRARVRNAALPPNTFPVEEGELEAWLAEFERPTVDELG
ncbi:ATP-binding protein [Phenylobacterium sp.]|jgi:predicted kinase|uniref:AAA family ATPase n=1 Tax=Phenylobacterium sp. TaxID=1871053 RepID=UPI002E351043|nr:ATP-binding protein [Phenylobacterium sp.]HEX3364426.1 ATP-binding protein [Phenylobacterium sp.]